MWSRNGTPVFASPRPAPSSLSATVTEVSRVLRSTSAMRLASAGAGSATGRARVLSWFRKLFLRLFCILNTGCRGHPCGLFCISIPTCPLRRSRSSSNGRSPHLFLNTGCRGHPCSQFHRARMPLEPFHPRQTRDYRSERRNRAPRRLDYTGSFQEIVCTQRRRKTRRTPGRQHVVGARNVVAERRRRERAEQNRARRLDP